MTSEILLFCCLWTPKRQFLRLRNLHKVQTTLKSGHVELSTNPPPLGTERGNTFWQLPLRREALLTGFLGVPGEGKFCRAPLPEPSNRGLRAQSLTISLFLKGGYAKKQACF